MSKVILLCGKIASGKTYYAKSLEKECGAVLLSCDDLMLTLFDHCLGEKHHDMAGHCLEYLNGIAVRLVKAGLTVVLDAGYWTKSDRDIVRRYFERQHVETLLCYLVCDESTRLERLQNRNKELKSGRHSHRVYIIEEETRRFLDAKFEPPEPEEYDALIDMTDWVSWE